MHKHSRGRTNDIGRATRLRDEKLNNEDIPSIRQSQDLVHVATYPGEVVCRSDRPDQVDFARCGGVLRGGCDECARV